VEALVLAAAGVVLGAASHVLWDGFTHRGGFFVSAIPVLRDQLGPFVALRGCSTPAGCSGWSAWG
ncbi:DUF4184 family protein, partial [Rathayibacter tanaceti]|uniref:DUF4184 family protein n=1 Tax=Rathayibacter tanaceti TaxID=1671680 RepID=UPI0012903303